MASLEFVDFAVNCSLDAVFVINDQAEFVYVNKAASTITGYTADELTAMKIFDLDAHFTMEQLWENWQRLQQHKVQTVETLVRTKAGKLVPAEILSTHMVFEGKEYCCSFLRDITHRKQIEEELRVYSERFNLIGRATNDPVYDWNIESNTIFWNEAAERMFGAAPDGFDKTLEWWENQIPEGQRETVVSNLKNAVERGDPCWTMEYQFRCGDSSLRTFIDRGYIIYNQAGKPLRMIGSMTDITYRKEYEAGLIEAKQKAEEATRAKSEFLANVSHEIRTPLTSLMGVSLLLEATDLSDEQRELVRTMKVSSDTLYSLIEQVLDFSKIESNKLTLVNRSFNIRETIHTVVTLFSRNIAEKNLGLNQYIGPGVPETVIGDSVRLQQILMNFLSNACKFTEQGEITLSCKPRWIKDDRIYLEFSVSDTGIGFSEEDYERIFESFTQLESFDHKRFSGTGLGLAICHRLIDLMGGEITVESKPNQGTRFSFSIPFTLESRIPPPKSKTEPEGTSFDMELASRFPLKILVVEDSAPNAFLLKKMLQQFGYESEVASNGLEAVNRLKSEPFHLVFMDIQMPVMDGFEAAHLIRNENIRQPVIVALSASASEEAHRQALEAGMDDYIAKPYKLESLKRCIEKAGVQLL